MVTGDARVRELLLVACRGVLLEVTQAQLGERDVSVAVAEPARRPRCLAAFDAQIDVVSAPVRPVEPSPNFEAQAARTAEEPCVHRVGEGSSLLRLSPSTTPSPSSARSESTRIRVVVVVDHLSAEVVVSGSRRRWSNDSMPRASIARFASRVRRRRHCSTRSGRRGARPRARSQRTIRPCRLAAARAVPSRRATQFLHSHKFGSNVWCALFARLARVPVFVTHEHSWSFTGDRLRVALDRRLIATRADAMIAVSSADARRMIAVERIAEQKIRVIPNGILRPVVADRGALGGSSGWNRSADHRHRREPAA